MSSSVVGNRGKSGSRGCGGGGFRVQRFCPLSRISHMTEKQTAIARYFEPVFYLLFSPEKQWYRTNPSVVMLCEQSKHSRETVPFNKKVEKHWTTYIGCSSTL